jgi:hypothetical protein
VNPQENFFNLKKYIIFALPNGVVAQLVEQRTENPCVTGSTPVDATRQIQNQKWQNSEILFCHFAFYTSHFLFVEGLIR